MKFRHVLVLAVAAALTAACGAGTEPGPAPQTSAWTEKLPPVGEPVTFAVYTHCGVESARIGGQWWAVTEPLYDDGGAGAPEGWDDPYQDGELTVKSPTRAVFVAHGREVELTPSATGKPVRVCR